MTHPVSDHAVVRYLERVHGLSHLTACHPDASDRVRARIGADLLGMRVDDVRDLVCPPRLHAALRLGAGYVRAPDRTLPFREGVVVTCLTPITKPNRTRRLRTT